MSADNQVDAGHFTGHFEVLVETDMGERDDLVDAFGLQFGCGIGKIGLFVREQDGRGGRRCFCRIRCQGADDADLLAANLDNQVILGLAGNRRSGTDQHAARNDRKRYFVGKFGQAFVTIIEFMVADHHGIDAELL